ncbi:hypothetical protein BO83DRAFT_403481 [Aspergillus eucalypticola CBS 122712]|uniref:Uncharacterized protein n=1 Tax=Aspergillus eucalypticola (strain CBS 122712 / IBT 29274) TaxID=1448314 RepID=A0A317UQW4_ASPEC|nr:uncharacterized protein BO83DRAFT_403481 [Aspergillus eucalypticola CBS 122712]PWY62927.1 hypothetical protein BO83DRAFT_403481 [Aspergillus eucalypticola CBS 122712]
MQAYRTELLTLDLHVKSSQTTKLGAHSNRDVFGIIRQIVLDALYEHTEPMGCSRKRSEVPSLCETCEADCVYPNMPASRMLRGLTSQLCHGFVPHREFATTTSVFPPKTNNRHDNKTQRGTVEILDDLMLMTPNSESDDFRETCRDKFEVRRRFWFSAGTIPLIPRKRCFPESAAETRGSEDWLGDFSASTLYSMVLDWPARPNVPADNKVARKMVTYGAGLMGYHRGSKTVPGQDSAMMILSGLCPLQYRPMASPGPVIDLLNTLMRN